MSVNARGGVGRAAEELVEAGLRFGGGAWASLGPASPAHKEMLSHFHYRAQQAEQHACYQPHPDSNTTLVVRPGEHCKQQGTQDHASAPLQTRHTSRQPHVMPRLLRSCTCQGSTGGCCLQPWQTSAP